MEQKEKKERKKINEIKQKLEDCGGTQKKVSLIFKKGEVGTGTWEFVNTVCVTLLLVVPIFQKGGKHQSSNYRPVSLTPITCKLLEHIIYSNIMHHLDQHRVLYDNQHGFRKKHSCKT